MNYLEWKHIVMNMGKTWHQIQQVREFEINNPFSTKEYRSKLNAENAKIEKIMSIPDRRKRLKTIARNLPLFD